MCAGGDVDWCMYDGFCYSVEISQSAVAEE